MPEYIRKRRLHSQSRLSKQNAGNEVRLFIIQKKLFVMKIIIDKDQEHLYEKEKVKIENVFKYTYFIPSRKHFFQIIQQGKYFSLSDKFTIKRFNSTNQYMNEIIINKREWAISEVHPRASLKIN